MLDIINVVLWIVWFAVVITLWRVSNKCAFCDDKGTTVCQGCKHYVIPKKSTNYEPKEEDEMTEVDFLAKRINALDDDEFFQLSKLVTRGYEDGRN